MKTRLRGTVLSVVVLGLTAVPMSAQLPVCGDENGDRALDAADVFHLINQLFSGGPGPQNCPAIGAINPATTGQAEGLYAAFDLAVADPDLAAGNITNGTTVFGVMGTAPIPSGTALPAQVLSGATFSNGSATGMTGTMPDNGAVTMTPGTAAQTIAAGYHNGSGTVAGDADLLAGNIAIGVTIFGVAGTMPAAGVEKTGQTVCYDPSGSTVNTIACADTGQDGAKQKGVAWPNPRFTNNGNGTVTDNVTGLIWLQNANCFSTQAWVNALTSANGLGAPGCGLSDGSVAGDWRLPNRKELDSLLDLAYSGPALSNAAGTGQWTEGNPFSGVQLNAYWASSTFAQYSTNAWGVNLDYGNVYSVVKSSAYYVWPVRGGQ